MVNESEPERMSRQRGCAGAKRVADGRLAWRCPDAFDPSGSTGLRFSSRVLAMPLSIGHSSPERLDVGGQVGFPS